MVGRNKRVLERAWLTPFSIYERREGGREEGEGERVQEWILL